MNQQERTNSMQHDSLLKVYLQVLLQVGVVLFNHGAEDIVRHCCSQCLLWKGFGPRFVRAVSAWQLFDRTLLWESVIV